MGNHAMLLRLQGLLVHRPGAGRTGVVIVHFLAEVASNQKPYPCRQKKAQKFR